MPDAAVRPVDLIIGRSLITAEAIAQELREKLISELASNIALTRPGGMLERARAILFTFEPLLAETLLDADLAGWIAGFDEVRKKTPEEVLEEFAAGFRSPPIQPPPPRFTLPGAEGPREPMVRFPLIDRAAERLQRANVVTREQFDQLTTELRQQAFTVARVQSEETIDTIRQTLAELVQEGPTPGEFRERITEALDGGPIGPAHLETVYRTNVQAAYGAAHDELASLPIVADLFPYQEYLAIRDGRVRDDHLALETLGLDGTNIYRRDDPMWDLFTPPWGYNCRCGVNLLTIEAAAAAGVSEAKGRKLDRSPGRLFFNRGLSSGKRRRRVGACGGVGQTCLQAARK